MPGQMMPPTGIRRGPNGVEGDRGAEIDDDAGSAVFRDGRDGIHDAVGADLAGIVV